MKRKIKRILIAYMLCIFLIPQSVYAADGVDIVYEAPETAKAGDKVSVKINLSGSTMLTTLGLRLNYDSEKLTYEGEQWADDLKNSGSAMTLVSDVVRGNGKALNISMISDQGYPGNGMMVTLTFSAKQDLAGLPVELEVRDATDKEMKSVTNTVTVTRQENGSGTVDNGMDSNQTENNRPEQSETEQVGSSTAPKRPQTYQTGIEDFTSELFGWGGALSLAGILCIVIKRRLSR